MQAELTEGTRLQNELGDATDWIRRTAGSAKGTRSGAQGGSVDDCQWLSSCHAGHRQHRNRAANETIPRSLQVSSGDLVFGSVGGFRGSFRSCVGFSVPLSHRIISGCDMILMPSRFEPCGLTQQYAIRYGTSLDASLLTFCWTGTIPVAHATGGLMDTIEDFMPFGDVSGNGFLFRQPDVEHLIRAIDRAVDTFRYKSKR